MEPETAPETVEPEPVLESQAACPFCQGEHGVDPCPTWPEPPAPSLEPEPEPEPTFAERRRMLLAEQ